MVFLSPLAEPPEQDEKELVDLVRMGALMRIRLSGLWGALMPQ